MFCTDKVTHIISMPYTCCSCYTKNGVYFIFFVVSSVAFYFQLKYNFDLTVDMFIRLSSARIPYVYNQTFSRLITESGPN